MNKRLLILIASIVLIVAVVGITAFYLLRDNSEQSALTVVELNDLGEKYLYELDYKQALVQFLNVIKVEPMNVRAYLGGTDAYLHLGNLGDTINWLKEGIEATGNKNLGLVLIGVEKSLIEGYIALAEAYEAEGLYEKALELLQRVYDESDDEIIDRKLGIVEASEIQFRDDYVIEWKDAAFENLIRQYLGKESDHIHYDDVKLIETIEIWGQMIAMPGESLMCSYSYDGFSTFDGREGKKDGKIETLADLEHFSSLNTLVVNHQKNLDISALSNVSDIDCLRRLTHLELIANDISDISAVSELIALRSLSLSCNDIADVSPVSMLIELHTIDLGDNKQLSSAEPLRGLRKLQFVYISGVNSVDLSIFVGMPELCSMSLVINESIDYSKLTQLNLDYLEITCDDTIFQTIKQLTSLTRLRLHGDGYWNSEDEYTGVLTNISGIGQLSNLTTLDLLANNCYDISPLASLNVETLEIELPDNCDLTPLAKMANLKKVIIPSYRRQSEDEETMLLIDKLRTLLPDVEVTSRY